VALWQVGGAVVPPHSLGGGLGEGEVGISYKSPHSRIWTPRDSEKRCMDDRPTFNTWHPWWPVELVRGQCPRIKVPLIHIFIQLIYWVRGEVTKKLMV
jgi:hypothetical protein